MPRRTRTEEHENHERWLVSYADFITLLFAFFVVMYAVSSVNEGKYRVLSNSLVSAFRNVTVNTHSDQVASIGVPSLPMLPAIRKPVRDMQAEETRRVNRQKMRDMAQKVADILGPLVRDGRVRVTETALGVTIEINASVLFAVGAAQLEPAAIKALQAVAGVLSGADFPITVEGHTDNSPIATPQFPSNWELSVVRASSVVRLFVDSGVPSKLMMATGYADQRPVADNETPDGRTRNRRVAILIESPDPAAQVQLPVVPRGVAGPLDQGVPRRG